MHAILNPIRAARGPAHGEQQGKSEDLPFRFHVAGRGGVVLECSGMDGGWMDGGHRLVSSTLHSTASTLIHPQGRIPDQTGPSFLLLSLVCSDCLSLLVLIFEILSHSNCLVSGFNSFLVPS